MYNPTDWYWKKDNETQAFSSARMTMVPANDSGLAAHVAGHGSASRWPVDEAGQQTQAALQQVLEPYGLDAGLLAYASRQRWKKEVGGIEVGGVNIATDDRSKQMIMGARIAAQADEDFTTTWVASDGAIVELNAAQVIGISNAVLAHVQLCFSTFATVKIGIDNNSITTRSQVDEAFED